MSSLQLELGKKSDYISQYCPEKLFPIPRKINREKIGVITTLPFFGYDAWHHFEVSWLNEQGKPMVALASMIFDCASDYLIESKSMKLYFNSLNNTKIKDHATVEKMIQADLEKNVGAAVSVSVVPLPAFRDALTHQFDGESLDGLDVNCDVYTLHPEFLTTESTVVTEVLHSDLLKSNCLVTGQPDWGSVQIRYTGKKINRAGLLKYIVSFRNMNEFSETAIERIFTDIQRYCHPTQLLVHGQFTRRGGIDINVVRSMEKIAPMDDFLRLSRQ